MKKVLLSVGMLVLLGACSTITEGTSQTLSLDSVPQGADCKLMREGAIIGQIRTPGAVVVQKTKRDITVVCNKDGFTETSANIKSDYAAATFGNILIGGGIGWAIDASSGAHNKYDANTMVTLTPAGAAAMQASRDAQLADLQQLLDKKLITEDEYKLRRQRIADAK